MKLIQRPTADIQFMFDRRLCMTNDVEMRKCETMQKAAYSRDIRPEFHCVRSDDCIESVRIRLLYCVDLVEELPLNIVHLNHAGEKQSK